GDKDGDGQADDAGKPIVAIQDGGDDKIQKADVDAEGKADVKVTFPNNAGYSVGDKVKITDQDDNIILERPLTQEDLNNGITVKVTPAAEGETTVVKAIVTDPAGNSSQEGQDESVTDLVVPGDTNGDGQADDAGKPIVAIQDGGDDKIQKADVDAEGKADVKVTFPNNAGYSVGDKVKITDQDDNIILERPLTQEDLNNGITVKVTPAAEGETTVVKAIVTDPAGNSSLEGQDESMVDFVRSAPTVIIGTDVNKPYGDDVEYIIKGEILSGSAVEKVSVFVSIPEDAKVGDILTLTANTESDPISYTVQEGDVGKTVTQSVVAPADGKELVVSATITAGYDANLVSSTGEAKATRDTSANIEVTIGGPDYFEEHPDSEPNGPYFQIIVSEDKKSMSTPASSITDFEETLYSGEVNKDGDVRVIFTLPSDAKVGDTLTYKVEAGGTRDLEFNEDSISIGELTSPHTYVPEVVSKVLDSSDIELGKVEVFVPAPTIQGQTIDVMATLTDKLGNEGKDVQYSYRFRSSAGDADTELAGDPAVLELGVSANTETEINGKNFVTAYEGVEDSKLTYTVNLNKPAQKDYKVAIKLSGDGITADEYTVDGTTSQWYPNGIKKADGAGVNHEGSTVVVTIAKGEVSASFTLTPKEDSVTEGIEVVKATVEKSVFDFGVAQGKVGGNGNFYTLGDKVEAEGVITEAILPGEILGGIGADKVTVSGNFASTFNGGEGDDTLIITGTGRTINFSNIMNVETIDISGSGANTLTNVNADNVNKSAIGSIYIKGDADDKVNIGYQNVVGSNLKDSLEIGAKTWSKGAVIDKDGVGYDTWSLSDSSAMIYIQQGIDVI
ncbi:hypothetical protein, partial [Rodentibacter genomosp. 1]|uniref:hypothetical protein n=1 Tax=Rodentibacter genomosp. 1 TaxID=1908264 RepID=UPI001300DCA3